MLKTRGYPNRLGVKGWAVGGHWGPERYLYTLHRVTGLGLGEWYGGLDHTSFILVFQRTTN